MCSTEKYLEQICSHHKNVNIEFEVNDSDKFAKPITFSSKKYRTLHTIYKK